MDTKKKELLGNFFRSKVRVDRTNAHVTVFDHDYPSAASGVLYPHGLFDLKRTAGHINSRRSHDTSRLPGDGNVLVGRTLCIRRRHPCCYCDDGGGSNSARRYVFKHALERLADRLGIEIRVAHYPPHTSKYNPIERNSSAT